MIISIINHLRIMSTNNSKSSLLLMILLLCLATLTITTAATTNFSESWWPVPSASGGGVAAVAKTTTSSKSWNAIDECWRGDRKWSRDRKRLADCAIGFGSETTGGKAGDFYLVTTNEDDAQDPKPGMLRYGAIQERPLWIYFAHDMTITLRNELLITGDKTLDGRGARVQIAYGPCLTIQYVSNVIVHGLYIHHCKPGKSGRVRSSASHIGYRRGSDGDGISVFGSRNVWIDHNSLASCTDGLIDVIHASSLVTISNNYFFNHNKVMLLGHSDSYVADKAMRVTIAFNHFGPGLVQRMPRCRFGFFHVVNNEYEGWGEYAIGGSAAPTIISEGNRFHPSSSRCKQVTKREAGARSKWQVWNWKSIDDTFLNGAYFIQSGSAPGTLDSNLYSSGDTATRTEPVKFSPYMTTFAGALSCSTGSAC